MENIKILINLIEKYHLSRFTLRNCINKVESRFGAVGGCLRFLFNCMENIKNVI